ncbi:MAG: M81 family metallopeptidase [Chloroflexota bacterium]
MPQILLAECMQEVSSFNPVLSHISDFVIATGTQILDHHAGTGTGMAGALGVFAEHRNVEVVPTYSARAITSAGPLAAADWDQLSSDFLNAVRDAPPVDGVYLSIHGAMATQNELDPEGYLLAEMRKILGEEIPIVASMDLHGIVTDQILQHANAIVAYHTYPHVDFYQTGQRSARLLMRILNEDVRPVTALVPIPALVRGNELITETGLFGKQIRAAQDIEASEGGLSAGMFIGNPFTDVPDLRSNSFVITDNDPKRAEAEAIRMAQEFWAVREQLQQPLISIDEAVEIVMNTKDAVIFSDAADATSSGASGDSNAILRMLLEKSYPGRALIPIVDSQAVQMAMRAGIGQSIRTTLGGRLDPQRFEPITVDAQVRMLSDGSFISESHGTTWYAGNTALLQLSAGSGSISVIATSRPVSLYDRSLFYAHGQDPRRFDLIVVKSPHCQHHFFEAWAERLLNVDAPGSTSANLPSLGHTVCARPLFPLDENVEFKPNVKLFQR